MNPQPEWEVVEYNYFYYIRWDSVINGRRFSCKESITKTQLEHYIDSKLICLVLNVLQLHYNRLKS